MVASDGQTSGNENQVLLSMSVIGRKTKTRTYKEHQTTKKPWSNLAVDLLEVPEGIHLLVLVDYYSRWSEVASLNKTDASTVNKVLQHIFQTHGLPDTLRSDNGPPFQSKEFKIFLDNLEIEHKRGIPLSPESNGEVERFNGTLMKTVRITKIENKDIKASIKEFLFQYRTTPHCVTGETPSKMLMGRELKTKIPKIEVSSSSETEWENSIRDREALRKLKSKECADQARKAEINDITDGDMVILENKFPSNKSVAKYELEPYKVIEKERNALIIENEARGRKMRNSNQIKKFITPQIDHGFKDNNIEDGGVKDEASTEKK